jgi:hypothetical protein
VHTKISFAKMGEWKIGDRNLRQLCDKEYGNGGKKANGVVLCNTAEETPPLSRNVG